MNPLIIYGFGMRGKSLYSALRSINIGIKCIVDGNSDNWGKDIDGISILAPEILRTFNNNAVCITMADMREKMKVRKEIRERYGFCGEEYDFFDLIFGAYKEMYSKVSDQSLEISLFPQILFDCHKGLGMGGIELWTKELCMQLINKGWNQLRIICDNKNYSEPQEIMNVVDKLRIDHSAEYGQETFWNVVHYLEGHLPFTVVTSFPDVVLMAACILKDKYPNQINIISVIHHGEEQFYETNIKFKDRIKCYIGVSEDIKEEMIKRGAKENQALNMTCPVQCNEKLERTYMFSEEEPVRIGYAGRLVVYKKRMDLLLKMIETLEVLGVNYRFEIAGEGSAREMMENYIQQCLLTEKVLFMGVLERTYLPAFWKRQDICVNIADCEGRCISKMEGMAGGAVPIVTDVAGAKEDIEDGENGYIVQTGDYITMAERINYLAGHRELLEKMGQKAHDSIFPKCQMAEHIAFWEKVLAPYKVM